MIRIAFPGGPVAFVRNSHIWSQIKITGLILWVGAVIMQALWLSNATDAAPVLLTIVGGILGTLLFARRRLLAAYPISAMMLIGFTSYYFLIPPIATLAEAKPLTNNLEQPTFVFLHALVCLSLLASAHLLYRRFPPLQGLRWTIAKKVYRPFGFFRSPSNGHLLMMGCLGLSAMAFQVFAIGIREGEVLGAGNKFMQALYPLSFLPYCMLVRNVMTPHARTRAVQWRVLAGYTGLLLVVALGRNNRAAFLEGIASVTLVYAYGVGIGLIRAPAVNMRRLLIALIGLVFLLGPVADLATSMIIVRSERGDLPARELIARTLESFWDKKAIAERRRNDILENAFLDEHYVDNLFLNRLANLKFADNSIGLAMHMSELEKSYFGDLEAQRALSVLPRPVLGLLEWSVDKDLVSGASGGDLLLYVMSGNRFVLGGFRTGSLFGSGYALFGWWYPVIIALAAMPVFALGDALTSRDAPGSRIGTGIARRPVLAPMAIVSFYSFCVYFTSAAEGIESMSGLAQYPFRGWIQILFIYAFAYWVTYLAFKPFRFTSR